MKKLIFFLALILCAINVGAIDVYYRYTDFQLTTQSVKRVTQTPLQPFADYNGAILTATPRVNVTDTNGVTYFSNTIPGYSYRVQLDTPYGSTIRTTGFPASLTGVVNGRDYLGDIHAMTFYYLYPTNSPFLAAGNNITIVTNGLLYTISATGGGGGGGNSTNNIYTTNNFDYSSAKILWVAPYGNNSTAVKGAREKPWLTPEAAVAASSYGDSIVIESGSYTTTTGINVPVGVNLFGNGNPTIINNNSGTTRAGVTIHDNQIIDGITITNMLMSSIIQICIGKNSINDNTSTTNCWLRNIVGYGDSDAFFMKTIKAVGLRMDNCQFFSKWDAMVIIGDSGFVGPVTWNLFNCVSVIYTESVFNPGMSGYTHALGMDSINNGRINVFGGYYASTNNSVGWVAAFEGTAGKSDLYAVGASFIGTRWYDTANISTSKIRVIGCITEGSFSDFGDHGDFQVINQQNWAATAGISIADSPDLTGATWTNSFGSDGGLFLGGTNLVGKGSLKANGTVTASGFIGNGGGNLGVTNISGTNVDIVFAQSMATTNGHRVTVTGGSANALTNNDTRAIGFVGPVSITNLTAYASDGSTILSGRTLYDSQPSASLNFGTRGLLQGAGAEVLNWDNGAAGILVETNLIVRGNFHTTNTAAANQGVWATNGAGYFTKGVIANGSTNYFSGDFTIGGTEYINRLLVSGDWPSFIRSNAPSQFGNGETNYNFHEFDTNTANGSYLIRGTNMSIVASNGTAANQYYALTNGGAYFQQSLQASSVTGAQLVATSGIMFRSNTYPITSWAALANSACVTWNSNGVPFLICTNSATGIASTNPIAAGAGGGSGTVTSVGITGPAGVTWANSPVTASGTLTATTDGTLVTNGNSFVLTINGGITNNLGLTNTGPVEFRSTLLVSTNYQVPIRGSNVLEAWGTNTAKPALAVGLTNAGAIELVRAANLIEAFNNAGTSEFSVDKGGAVTAVGSGSFGGLSSATRFVVAGLGQMKSTLNGTVVFQNNAGSAIASAQFGMTNVTKTANYTVVALDSGTAFNNIGAAGAVTNTLPTSTLGRGDQFWFYVGAAQILCVQASGTDKIRYRGTLSAAAGNIFANSIGSYLHIFNVVAGEWICDNVSASLVASDWTGPQ